MNNLVRQFIVVPQATLRPGRGIERVSLFHPDGSVLTTIQPDASEETSDDPVAFALQDLENRVAALEAAKTPEEPKEPKTTKSSKESKTAS